MGASLGLRVDVCTYRGMRRGVPRLLELFARHRVQATFFVTLGPDCSGRAVARLWRKPGFATKMARTGGLRLYGVRTALYGTLLPAPCVAVRSRSVLERLARSEHEVGLHAWNHVRWQDALDRMSIAAIREDYALARQSFEEILERPATCTAAPAWLASTDSLRVVEECGFRFASDTRGSRPFLPDVDGEVLRTPQVPATLPTLDERLGRGLRAEDFYSEVLAVLRGGPPQVLVAHAEAEGGPALDAFERFLEALAEQSVDVLPLGSFLERTPQPLPVAPVTRGLLAGRAGEVSLQGVPEAG